jgi:hypothetical protein
MVGKRWPKGTLELSYLVAQDPEGGRWNVSRGGVPTGAFARDKSTAIGQAYQAASKEAHGTTLKVTVWSIQNGKRLKEWESP